MTGSSTLAVFVDDLLGRLAALSGEQLREILLAHGSSLPSRGRAGFLDLFPTAPVSAARGDDSLLSEIESFVSDLEAGAYFLGFGWDEQIHDKRSFGDESWVPAREAYAALFGAFRLDDEVGTFCGQKPVAEMVDTDLREAGARYLRTVYHTSEVDEMPADLRDAWTDDLPYGTGPVSIDEVRQALPEDLPGLDAFWPRWIDELRWVEGDAQMRGLLTEAVHCSAGLDGLAVLARERDDRQAEHCLTWIDALAAEGRDADAVAAAQESLTMVVGAGRGRAQIADRLADLADLLDARREAWRAEPTGLRLRALYEAAPELAEVLAVEVARPLDGMNDCLQAELLLLAGEVDRVACLLDGDHVDDRRSGG